MHISDVHDYLPAPNEKAAEFLSQNRKDAIKREVTQIVDDEFDRLTEYADDHISQAAAWRAERFLERVLSGDDNAAMALLGDKHGHSRYRIGGSDNCESWAKLIHGTLFETGGIMLRRKIVEAHPDLIRNERIADLESIVAGLTKQVRDLTAQLNRL